MHYVVVGAGFSGRRVLLQLGPECSIGIRRSDFDLDLPTGQPFELPAVYSLLYTVPPGISNGKDQRLVHLLSSLRKPPERFVYISTSGVYGDRDGRVVTEDDPVAPQSDRGRARVVAERTLSDWCGEHGVNLYTLRVPGIYGPERLGLARIEAGEPEIAEAEANPGNRIHVDDLAAACVQALTADVLPGVYNVGDGDHRSATWFAGTVARLAGMPAPPEISRAEAENTISESRRSFQRESRIVDTTKMRDVLGFTPRYTDAEDGIRASLSCDVVR